MNAFAKKNLVQFRLLTLSLSLLLLGSVGCKSHPQTEQSFHQLLTKAQSGDSDAQYRLGRLYSQGSPETPKDMVKAVEWFRRSAEKGDAKGELALGIAYQRGDGVLEDQAVGFDWLYKSALKGTPRAQALLGSAYYAGHGIPKDESEGLDWILVSARNGYSRSQVFLCSFYQEHTRLGTDPTMGYAWCLISRTTDPKGAEMVAKGLSKAESILTPSQLAEARMLASSWNANHKTGGTMPLHSRSFLTTGSNDAQNFDPFIKSPAQPPAAMRGRTRGSNESQNFDPFIKSPTQPPTVMRGRGGSGGCEAGHWVDSVMSDGEIVKLEDGSIWRVDGGDSIDSSLWLVTEEITVCDGKLINTDDDSSVGAHRIK